MSNFLIEVDGRVELSSLDNEFFNEVLRKDFGVSRDIIDIFFGV